MRILDRYIGRAVVTGTLGALLVVLGIELFFAFVSELGDIGRGDYGLVQALKYLALTTPRRLYDVFPMAALLGSLLTLGALASNSELVVMRSAGISVARIARSVMQAGLALVLLMLVVGELIAPPAEEYAQRERALAQWHAMLLQTVYGYWARDGANIVNVRQMLPGGVLSVVSIYDFDAGHRLRSITQANSGVYRDRKWLLKGVRQSFIGENAVTTRRLATLEWPSLLDPEILDVVVVRPVDMSMYDLFRYVRYLRDNGLDARPYSLAFWTRVVNPFSSLMMLFLALPFVFGGLRSVGAGHRIVVGVLVGMTFYLLNQLLGHLGQVYGLNPILSAAAPTLVFFGAGLWGLHRVR